MLRIKLFIFLIVLIFITTTSSGFIALKLFNDILRDDLIKEAIGVSENISNLAIDPILRDSEVDLYMILKEFVKKGSYDNILLYAMVLKNDGKILASSDPDRYRLGSKINGDILRVSNSPIILDKESIMEIGYPIRIDTERIGMLYIGVTKIYLMKVIKKLKFSIFLTIFIVNSIGIFLLSVIMKKLSPLKDIIYNIRSIEEEKYDSLVDIEAGDEIEEIASGLKRIATKEKEFLEEKKKAELIMEKETEELRKLKEEIIHKERLAAVGKLIGDLSHEINNPLGIIKNYITLMMKKGHNGDIKIINEEINRISAIVRELMNLYQLPIGEIEPVDINLIINDLLKIIEKQLTGRNIKIDVKLEDTIPKVVISHAHIKQVILNMIKNAESSMPGGGILRIKTLKRKNEIEIHISDTGHGIKKEDIEQIFDPLKSGLELSIVYRLIREYNGNIRVESELGRGSTFKVIIPCQI
jgi:signal transduction histidine kinase